MSDPSLPGITLAGQVNTNVTNWMGSITAIDDTAATELSTSLASLVRDSGENVGTYNITSGTLTALIGSSAGNYSAPIFSVANSPTLSITPASGLSASITVPGISKVYGVSDPSLPGITLAGQVNTNVTNWMGTITAIDDTAATELSTSLASLVRDSGENVGTYNITSGTLTALIGSSAGNYSAPTFSVANSPTLSITPASGLSASITVPGIRKFMV